MTIVFDSFPFFFSLLGSVGCYSVLLLFRHHVLGLDPGLASGM